MIERAYTLGERLGFQVWATDQAGPYQTIPHPGSAWCPEGTPIKQAHQYLRGHTCKLLTLFRPSTGVLHGQTVDSCPNAVLHPWLMGELTTILKACEPAQDVVPTGKRWQDWDIYPAAEHLDRRFPPIRMLLILDNLAGHHSHCFVQWCAEHGICLLYTPTAGSWLNMAESVQRIIVRRAIEGHHIYDVEILKDWLVDTVEGWNRHPTPFSWGGKRHTRRDRAYARRHRVGGSGAVTHAALPKRLRSVRFYRRGDNAIELGK